MLIYLARHAQTASSKVDSYNGRAELPLTGHGLVQARALGLRLAGVAFAAVYRSPLGRTEETAALVAPGQVAQVSPGLIEIDYGAWEGHSSAEARARDPERFAAWLADPVANAPPGGETIAQVAERALAALLAIAKAHPEGAVLAVSHKATLRALGAALVGAPLSTYRTRWVSNTA